MSAGITRGTVVIDTERCKGCELCVPVCRPKVLSMSTAVNATGYPYPQLAPGCTACNACHDVCPDFVFQVIRFSKPIPDEEAVAVFGSKGSS